jgi:hypothetical protein
MRALRIILAITLIQALSVVQASWGADNPPPAPTLAGLNAESSADSAALPGLNATMSQATEANISLAKERAVYTTDQKAKIASAKAAIQYQTDVVQVEKYRPHNEQVATYNGQCSGTLPKPQYDTCMGWRSRLESEAHQLDAEWGRYQAAWNKANIEPLNEVILKQNARIDVIDAQIKRNFAAFTAAQDRSLALRKRIKEIEGIFRDACSSKPLNNPFTRAETMKWCASIPWDGASARLVPMYKYRGTGGVTSN